MQNDLENYKNINKSSDFFLAKNKNFSILHLKNDEASIARYIHSDCEDYVYFFFNLNVPCKIAFNVEHCSVSLKKNTSYVIYFKEHKMDLLFDIYENSSLVMLLISLKYFHSLFTSEENEFFNYDISVKKPIMEKKQINLLLKEVLSQLISKKKKPLYNLFVNGKMYELLSAYFEDNEDNGKENCLFVANEQIVGQLKQAKDIIIKRMSNPPSLENLAKIVGLNIKKLKQGFKKIYGYPVFSFLLNYKLEFAKKLLIENQLNVNEIGNKIGYNSPSHFILAFKKKFNITPKQFAKKNSL